MVDLVIENGTVVIPRRGSSLQEVAVQGGRVVGLHAPGTAPPATRVIDARGLHVLPGAIDAHIHLGGYQDLAFDVEHGTRYAARGGVTCLVNYFKGTASFHDVVPGYIETFERLSLIDAAFHLQFLADIQLQELESYVREYGVTSYKINLFWKNKTRAVFGSDRNIDNGWMMAILEKMARIDPDKLVLNVHCENMEIRDQRIRELKPYTEDSLRFLERLSPRYAETDSLLSAVLLSRATGGRVFLVHLNTLTSVEALREFPWAWSERVTTETCPHYLYYHVDSPVGLRATVSPPLRYPEDNAALWDGLRDGVIDSVGSDANPIMLKTKLGNDFWTNKPGFDGVGMLLPLMLHGGYHSGRMPLERAVEVLTEAPARAFGLYPRKGTIQVGADADFAIVDLNREQVVGPELLEPNCDFNIYEGLSLKGWPVYTISRGEVIFEQGKVVGRPGHGRYLARSV